MELSCSALGGHTVATRQSSSLLFPDTPVFNSFSGAPDPGFFGVKTLENGQEAAAPNLLLHVPGLKAQVPVTELE